MSNIIPPGTAGDLRRHLETCDCKVYLVVGRQDRAFAVGTAVLGEFADTEEYFATQAEDVVEWVARGDVSGWPEGAPWTEGVPVGVCFGFGAEPQFYLTRAQAEDMDIVDQAHSRALAITEPTITDRETRGSGA